MERKVYAYPGIIAGDILISFGRGYLRIQFEGGYLDRKLNRPAIYATSDPITQAIIEKSDLFGRRIFLKDVTGMEEPVCEPAAKPAEAAEPKPEGKVYPNVKTWPKVAQILKAIPGVKADEIKNKEDGKRVAERYNYSFPGFSFD